MLSVYIKLCNELHNSVHKSNDSYTNLEINGGIECSEPETGTGYFILYGKKFWEPTSGVIHECYKGTKKPIGGAAAWQSKRKLMLNKNL